MNGIAPFVEGLVWFKLYWAAWALLLAVVASLFWVRGRERGARARLALARQRLQGPALAVAALAVVLIVGLGGFVFYNTNVVSAYRTPDALAAQKALYERRYKRFENAPTPRLVAVQTHVELHPSKRSAEVRGTFRFVNRTAQPIDTLHVLLSEDVETGPLRFDRAARLVKDDQPLAYRIYTLAQPLAPGDSLALHFEVLSRPRGFQNAGAPTDVTVNGTYLDRRWLPMLGYQRSRELTDEHVRREHGLPLQKRPPSAGDVEMHEAEPGARGPVLVDVETVIGTEADQTAVTPGTLVREWRAGGRRYFQYQSDRPTRYGGAVLSAAYAVREARWKDVTLRVLYHPGHEVNVDRMLRSMQAALAYYTAHFGLYPARKLEVVEFPLYASGARAHPAMITFSEGSAFLTRVDPGGIDRTAFVIAHETAHQWWGGQVIPAASIGASFVSETLAQYSAIMVMEQMYGPAMARRFAAHNLDEYLRNRGAYTNREAPLLDVVGQQYVHYFKGVVAMYLLRERVGETALNTAVRRFREKYAAPDAPPATSRALYAELQAAAPDSLQPLLSDLFEHITLWNMRTDSVRAEAVGGAYRVTLFVDASKVRANDVGRETPVAMSDLIEVGVYAGSHRDDAPGATLYLRQHRIRTGKQTIVLTVPRRPTRAGIDPRRTLIDREPADNLAEVSAPSGRGAR